MRLKLLLFLLFVSCGVLKAQQDTIKYLIFSEVRMDEHQNTYVEITNMGDKAVDLSKFEIGTVTAWTLPYQPLPNFWLMLPNKMLDPGKSFVVVTVYDLPVKMAKIDPERWSRVTKEDWWTGNLADIQLNALEPTAGIFAIDSVSVGWSALESWNGRNCFYLEQHLSAIDSVVVDALNNIFDETDGTKSDQPSDVAGYANGTREAILYRKFSVKTGNTDWVSARGIDITDSEWLPVPRLEAGNEPDRAVFWTVGNHSNYVLDQTTLQSTTVTQNWAASTLTVPFGVRKDDDIMKQFVKKPGIAWHYTYAPNREDSAYFSVRTGDTLTVYAVGNTLMTKEFALIAAAPGPDAKVVVPKMNFNPATNRWSTHVSGAQFKVTVNNPGMDTIMATLNNNPWGMAFATRVDTLLKYLEKPANASWQILWVDGKERVDLLNGDKLKVTAENGTTKEYFIKVANYLPSHNANLASITWPDIPVTLKGILGWTGDTIPSFAPAKYDYVLDIPSDVPGFPALISSPQNLNCKVAEVRGTSLSGSVADKTIVFNTTAEDDTSFATYNVIMNKAKDPDNIQPWKAEPFISQFVDRPNWSSVFIEICNPGTAPLDLSNYMIVRSNTGTPAEVIQSNLATTDWNNRFLKYVPGYIWQNQANWEVQPGLLQQDLNVNPMVYPGDVFVLGSIGGPNADNSMVLQNDQRHRDLSDPVDVWFRNNMWGETFDGWNNIGEFWFNNSFWLLKIVNDSIPKGLKPVGDPADFEVVDVWGPGDGSNWIIGGVQADQVEGYIRKPQFYKGNTTPAGSFGTNAGTSEWLKTSRSYWNQHSVYWPDDVKMEADGLGSHFLNEVTIFKSTVSSNEYKVSEGYSQKETIRGVKTNTTVADFLTRIIKANPDQSLKLKTVAGKILGSADKVSMGDSLIVLSADSVNTSKYILNVTAKGLSTDALLTSAKYYISVEWTTGNIYQIPYGTTVSTVLSNVTVPIGATLTVIDKAGKYVPLQTLNFDTMYVATMVSDKIFFHVVAEDGVTTILYQLTPVALASDAFVTSELYSVDQTKCVIALVPRGTTVATFLKNVFPVIGATVKMTDKTGKVRTMGYISQDDKLIVTSKDGKVTKVYFLNMLDTEFFTTRYLAYVLSDAYKVDQQNMVITGATSETLVPAFLGNLFPSFGASAVVVNAEGVETTGNDLNRGDRVKVTAADGYTIAFYSLALDYTSVTDLGNGSLLMYPNPTTGKVNISGLAAGNRIKVYNLLGAPVLDRIAGRTLEIINLENQPAGLYFITVSNADQVLGKCKLVKQ